MASSSNNQDIDPALHELGEHIFGNPVLNLNATFSHSQDPNLQNLNYPPPTNLYQYPPSQQYPENPYAQAQVPQPPNPYYAHSSGGSSSTPAPPRMSPPPQSASEIRTDETPSQATAATDGGTPSSAAAKKRKVPPKYNAAWWRFFEKKLNTDGHLVSAKCKVQNCKAEYAYDMANGTNSFKRHTEKHIKDGVKPQEPYKP